MVFFQCDGCGEALKKNKVESHRYQCRNSSVSCIDCNKVFPGNSYVQHNQCVSEAERYQGQLYKGAPSKQARKQEQQQGWLANVRAALDNASGVDAKMRDVLNRLVAYDNIPRKKAKFENFCRNSLAVRDEKIIARIWDDYINVAAAPANGAAKEESVTPEQTTDAGAAKEEKTKEEPSVANGKTEDAKEEKKSKKEKKQKSTEEKDKKKSKKESKQTNESEKEASAEVATQVTEKKSKKEKKQGTAEEKGKKEQASASTEEKETKKKGSKRKVEAEEKSDDKKAKKSKKSKA